MILSIRAASQPGTRSSGLISIRAHPQSILAKARCSAVWIWDIVICSKVMLRVMTAESVWVTLSRFWALIAKCTADRKAEEQLTELNRCGYCCSQEYVCWQKSAIAGCTDALSRMVASAFSRLDIILLVRCSDLTIGLVRHTACKHGYKDDLFKVPGVQCLNWWLHLLSQETAAMLADLSSCLLVLRQGGKCPSCRSNAFVPTAKGSECCLSNL